MADKRGQLPMPVILSEVKDLLVQGLGSPHAGGEDIDF
jgi:hypothetical protein